MFTEAELEQIREMAAQRVSVDEIAEAFGIHPDTLGRRLMKKHGIVLEHISACRLTPVDEFLSRPPQQRTPRRVKRSERLTATP